MKDNKLYNVKEIMDYLNEDTFENNDIQKEKEIQELRRLIDEASKKVTNIKLKSGPTAQVFPIKMQQELDVKKARLETLTQLDRQKRLGLSEKSELESIRKYFHQVEKEKVASARKTIEELDNIKKKTQLTLEQNQKYIESLDTILKYKENKRSGKKSFEKKLTELQLKVTKLEKKQEESGNLPSLKSNKLLSLQKQIAEMVATKAAKAQIKLYKFDAKNIQKNSTEVKTKREHIQNLIQISKKRQRKMEEEDQKRIDESKTKVTHLTVVPMSSKNKKAIKNAKNLIKQLEAKKLAGLEKEYQLLLPYTHPLIDMRKKELKTAIDKMNSYFEQESKSEKEKINKLKDLIKKYTEKSKEGKMTKADKIDFRKAKRDLFKIKAIKTINILDQIINIQRQTPFENLTFIQKTQIMKYHYTIQKIESHLKAKIQFYQERINKLQIQLNSDPNNKKIMKKIDKNQMKMKPILKLLIAILVKEAEINGMTSDLQQSIFHDELVLGQIQSKAKSGVSKKQKSKVSTKKKAKKGGKAKVSTVKEAKKEGKAIAKKIGSIEKSISEIDKKIKQKGSSPELIAKLEKEKQKLAQAKIKQQKSLDKDKKKIKKYQEIKTKLLAQKQTKDVKKKIMDAKKKIKFLKAKKLSSIKQELSQLQGVNGTEITKRKEEIQKILTSSKDKQKTKMAQKKALYEKLKEKIKADKESFKKKPPTKQQKKEFKLNKKRAYQIQYQLVQVAQSKIAAYIKRQKKRALNKEEQQKLSENQKFVEEFMNSTQKSILKLQDKLKQQQDKLNEIQKNLTANPNDTKLINESKKITKKIY